MSGAENNGDIDRLADFCARRGLTAPLLMLLESMRPLRGVGSIVGEAYAPILAAIVGSGRWQMVRSILASEEGMDRCIAALESRSNRTSSEVR